MPDAIQFTLSDGTPVLVEPAARAGTSPVGLGDHVEEASRTLRQALAPVTSAAAEVIDELRALAHRPDEVEVSFGVTLDGKLGGIIASAKAGGHLDIKVRWTSPGAAPDSGARPAS